ncbi:MAG: peptidase S41, partial [Bacteroidetes bacterium]
MLLLLVSCERIAMKPDVENTPEAVFESLWTTVDEKYSFFAYKNIDWDSIYRRYRPEIHGGISEELLFRYCAGALFALRDGHVNIESSWNVSRNWDWKLDYPENLNSTLVTRNYLGKDYWITGALENQILREEVGYVRYRSFTSPVSEEDIDKVLERFSLLKGMIIDVRGNGGGDMGNITTLVSRFTSSPFVYGTFVQKSGPGHEDFTEPIALKQSATKSPPY